MRGELGMSGRRTPLPGRIGRADRRSTGFGGERYGRGWSELGRRLRVFDKLNIRRMAERAVIMIKVRQNPAMDLRERQLRSQEQRQRDQRQRFEPSTHNHV